MSKQSSGAVRLHRNQIILLVALLAVTVPAMVLGRVRPPRQSESGGGVATAMLFQMPDGSLRICDPIDCPVRGMLNMGGHPIARFELIVSLDFVGTMRSRWPVPTRRQQTSDLRVQRIGDAQAIESMSDDDLVAFYRENIDLSAVTHRIEQIEWIGKHGPFEIEFPSKAGTTVHAQQTWSSGVRYNVARAAGEVCVALVILVIAMLLISIVRRLLAHYRLECRLCVKCGYDLRGSNSEACPECGEPRETIIKR